MKRFLFITALFVLAVAGCRHQQNFTTNPGNMNPELMLSLHNEERGSRTSLEIDSNLANRAQEHAEWMANRNRLVHSNLKVDGGWRTVGENIAKGQNSEEHVVHSWMNSFGHKRNILNNNFTNVGFGHAVSQNGTRYWCTIFGG